MRRTLLAAVILAAVGLLPPLLAEAPGLMVGLLLILVGLRSSWSRRGGRCLRRASAPGRAHSLARGGPYSASQRSGRVQGRPTTPDALQGPFWRRAGQS